MQADLESLTDVTLKHRDLLRIAATWDLAAQTGGKLEERREALRQELVGLRDLEALNPRREPSASVGAKTAHLSSKASQSVSVEDGPASERLQLTGLSPLAVGSFAATCLLGGVLWQRHVANREVVVPPSVVVAEEPVEPTANSGPSPQSVVAPIEEQPAPEKLPTPATRLGSSTSQVEDQIGKESDAGPGALQLTDDRILRVGLALVCVGVVSWCIWKRFSDSSSAQSAGETATKRMPQVVAMSSGSSEEVDGTPSHSDSCQQIVPPPEPTQYAISTPPTPLRQDTMVSRSSLGPLEPDDYEVNPMTQSVRGVVRGVSERRSFFEKLPKSGVGN